jgi:hypothetical protein
MQRYPSFLIIQGSATITSPATVRLTPSKPDMRGSVFFNKRILGPISISFTIKMVGGAADGMALVLQSHSPTSLGTGGSGLGYHGIPSVLAVEFDTFHSDGDPDGMHVSLQNGSSHHRDSLVYASLPPINDGRDVGVVCMFSGEGVNVWMEIGRVMKFAFSAKISVPEGGYWIGFTAATGGLCQEHWVKGVKISK